MKIFNWIEFIKEEYKSSEGQRKMVKKWLSKQNIEDDSLIDRFFNVYPKLDKKDINSYNNIEELLSGIKKAESWKTAREEKKESKKDAIKKTFGDITVVLTLTPKASSFYGSGTTWCTAASDTNYHWYAHRIIGVEFYIFDKSRTDNLSKISVHINWNEKYSTIYDAENSPDFGGKRHEYFDVEELYDYLKSIYGNEEISKWVKKEFDLTKRDAPKFIGNTLKKFVDNGDLKTMVNKFNYFTDGMDRIIDSEVINMAEYEYILENLISVWVDEYAKWFRKLTFEDIILFLEKFRERREDLDDHVFLLETVVTFLKESEIFNRDVKNIPIIFDTDDLEWLDDISSTIGISVDEISEFSDEISNHYNSFDIIEVDLEDRFDKHCEIIVDFFQTKI